MRKAVLCLLCLLLEFPVFAKAGFKTPVESRPCADKGRYKVHLTFDDGPVFPQTEQVLNTLEKINKARVARGEKPIRVTFFLTMCHFTDPDCDGGHPNAAKKERLMATVHRMVKDGHTIGNHSGQHISHAEVVDAKGTELPARADKILRNLEMSFQAMEALRKQVEIPEPVPFRFPFGDGWLKATRPENQAMSDKVMASVRAHGYVPTHWDIESADWSAIKRVYLPDSVLNQICSHHGGIVLDHDVQAFTANNIGALIESIVNSGHELVSLAEITEESKKQNYVSLATSAVWYKNCGGMVRDRDQFWTSCDVYQQRSTDRGHGGAVESR